MPDFPYNSFRHRQDKQLLHSINEAVFVLKLEAQGKLNENGFKPEDAKNKRIELSETLEKLSKAVGALSSKESSKITEFDLSFAGLANKFIEINPNDVNDRIDELHRLRQKLLQDEKLLSRNFQLLDKIQSFLETEVLAAFKDLYRL